MRASAFRPAARRPRRSRRTARAAHVEVRLSSFDFTPERRSALPPAGRSCSTSSTPAAAATISRRPQFFAAASGVSGPVRRGTVEVPGHQSVDIRLTPARGSYRLRCTHTPPHHLRHDAARSSSNSGRIGGRPACRRGKAGSIGRASDRARHERRQSRQPGSHRMAARQHGSGRGRSPAPVGQPLPAALCGGALPGELDDFSGEDCRAAAEFIAACAARRPPGIALGPARIDRHQARPAADADRHRQRRHAVPGRFRSPTRSPRAA